MFLGLLLHLNDLMFELVSCRDYRWADYPARGYIIPHPHDVSVQTFRGHSVLQTLIRAYFSPVHTTGQRFIYTGSVDGTVRIYGAYIMPCP